LAVEINAEYTDQHPIFIIVLKGAFMFGAELLQNITIDCRVAFIKLTSYEGTSSTGKVIQDFEVQENLKDENVVIIEDIVDTGTTLEYLQKMISKENPKSLRIATLLFKEEVYTKPYNIDYVGFNIPNRFVIGYGLDYDGWGRNLDGIFVMSNENKN